MRLPARIRPAAWVLAALAVLDLAVVANRDAWDRHSPDDYAERVAGCAAAPRDVVFLGGSPVSEGFDPTAFAGLTWAGSAVASAYNLGLPGGTLTDAYFALKAGTSGQPPPRLAVYGFAPTDLNDARNEPHGPYAVWTAADWADSFATRPDSREWATRHFCEGRLRRGWALFRYRHGVRLAAALAADEAYPGLGGPAAAEARVNLAYSAALRAGTGYAPAAGYARTRYDESKAAGKKPAPFDFLQKYRTGSHAKYLAKLADRCAAGGTTLVVVRMPVTADFQAKYAAETRAAEAELAAFVAASGVRVIDAGRGRVGLTDADFADIIHLNTGGAAELSAWVRGELAKAGGP